MVHFFIDRKILVNLLIIVIVLYGVFSLESLKRESMPEIDINQMVYTTIYPGAAPEDVELKITIPLEDAIKDVDDIKEMKSVSYENISSIEITLEDYLNQDDADKRKQDIQKAIDRVVDLPNDIKGRPELFEVKMTRLPIIEVALTHHDPLVLRKSAKYLTKKLEKLKAVAEVTEVGILDREIYINLDPDKLIKNEIPIDDVANALKSRNIRLNGGKLIHYDSERSLVIDEQLVKINELNNVILRSSYGGQSLRIRDICQVESRLEEPTIVVRSNGKAGISLAIVKKEKEDVLRTIKAIKALVNKEQSVLPTDLRIDFVNDEAVFTRNRVKIVLVNALLGFFLVLASVTNYWVALTHHDPLVLLKISNVTKRWGNQIFKRSKMGRWKLLCP